MFFLLSRSFSYLAYEGVKCGDRLDFSRQPLNNPNESLTLDRFNYLRLNESGHSLAFLHYFFACFHPTKLTNEQVNKQRWENEQKKKRELYALL